MSEKRVLKLVLTVFLITLFLAIWCTGQKTGSALVKGASVAITHVTSGNIEADSVIGVRFGHEQVRPELVGQEMLKNPFQFSPNIAGQAYWQDRHTLVFAPSKPLYAKRNYFATLDLASGAEKLTFQFSTLGQKLLRLDGNFLSTERAGAIFVSDIAFSERVGREAFLKAFSLEIEGKAVMGNIETEDNKAFQIRTENLARPLDKPRLLILKLKGELLGLGQDVQAEYTLAPQGAALTAERIEEEKETDGDYSRLNIVFSDLLDPHKDYSGYLNITPAVPHEVTAQGNRLQIVGPFLAGAGYNIRLFPGLRGALGQELKKGVDYLWEVEISQRDPAVEFVEEGLFLTTAAEKSVRFRTMNVERLRLQVKRIEEDNLIAFFAENSYRPNINRFEDYNRYGFLRMGEILEDRYITVEGQPNQWVVSELDLSSVIKDKESALYIIQLDFDETHALYFSPEMDKWDISSHVNRQGRAIQHLLVSDVGITAKEMPTELHVFLTDLLTTESLAEALVLLKDQNGHVLEQAYSDPGGWAILKSHHQGRYLEVHGGDRFALLDLQASRLNQAIFAVGGTQSQRGVNAFLYTERGVYRPGDEINLAAIVRNEDNTFPKNHPLTLKVYNPQEQLQHELVAAEALDGFYSFAFSTKSTDPTGIWLAVLEVGGRKFSQHLRIEEIVPHRIRVTIDAALEELADARGVLDFGVKGEYLFGAPAPGLASETEAFLESYEVSFADFPDFSFENATVAPFLETRDFAEDLDEGGAARFTWKLPTVGQISSGLRLRLQSRVYESGGRPVLQTEIIPIRHFPAFVGIQKPESGHLQLGAWADFQIVHLSAEGKPLAHRELEYAIYRLERYWWWEYDSETSFRRHFKANEHLIKEKEGAIRTNDLGTAQIRHQLGGGGEMVLQVTDPQGGHQASYFFRSWWWGDSKDMLSPAVLGLHLDKEEYSPGERAQLSLSAPPGSRALITVEKEAALLYQAWEDIQEKDSLFELEIKAEYIPNAYVSVMVYQPYGQRENDLPLRLHGIVPLQVASLESRLELALDLPAAIRPAEDFTVGVQSKDGRSAQFTVAVVDEGLLNITGFSTPDPWGHFFAKQRLLTVTYDNFSDIIGPTHGYVHNLFTVGGGLETDYRQMQTPDGEARRFEPVSIFAGPFNTDENGFAEVELQIPNYIGSIQVMVVAAAGGSYGSAEGSVPVQAPVMVLPTLPRVLRPMDSLRVPVTVFAEEALGEVAVRMHGEGPLEIRGPRELKLEFTEAGSKEVYFQLKAPEEMGAATLTIAAEAGALGNEAQVVLPIRPGNPYVYLSTEKLASAGEMARFTVPPAAVAGTDYAQLTISPLRGLNINHRLQWLERYPFLCVEQITSGAFPLLYFPDLLDFDQGKLAKIDEHVNDTIHALKNYQLRSGGFAYWPGGGAAHLWSTNYVGHFLLEAAVRGYHVPAELLAGWSAFQTEAARQNSGDYLTRVYRLYLLALADHAPISALNYMRESELNMLGNVEKHLLAAAYQILGYDGISMEILSGARLKADSYLRYNGIFGSELRDEAIILDVLTLIETYEEGVPLYDRLAQAMSSNNWYSTQTTAFALMALSKYAKAVSAQSPLLTGVLLLDGKEPLHIKEAGPVVVIPLQATGGEGLVFQSTAAVPLFVTLEWEGIPKPADLAAEQSKLTLEVEYFDETGARFDPGKTKQGTTFYALLRAGQEASEDLSELALVYILPAGWEIENLRLLEGGLPPWAEKYNLGTENYLDIRDDRLMWFFDMRGWVSSYDFIVKLNAVTVGEFTLPPTLFEAMYDNNYKVVKPAGRIEVQPR